MNNRFKSFTPQEIGVLTDALGRKWDQCTYSLDNIHGWLRSPHIATDNHADLLTQKLEVQIALKVTKELLAELEQENQ